jgi:diguanylate cyclase (GGDEF)-like protein
MMLWKRKRRMLVRPLSWAALLAVLALDAAVASSVSLGLLYFVPLVYAAFRLPRTEALLFAAVCTVGRVVFGPTGDPLGLQGLTYRLPPDAEPVVNAGVAGIAYVAVAFALVRLREQARQIRRLDRQVETDPLTGLPNRRALQRALDECVEAGVEIAVLVLDVDHFKRVNDTHGHDGGDAVLREIARRLEGCVRSPDLVARTGGEEFAVLLPDTSIDAARTVAERIRGRVRNAPIVLGSASLAVSVSVGCAHGAASDELLRVADRAMYEAKRAGRDRVLIAA